MACEKPYVCVIVLLCVLALLFHIAGFVTPGWLIMKRSVEDGVIFKFEGQLIDNGGLTVPPGAEDEEPKAAFRKKRSHSSSEDSDDMHGPHHGPHHGSHHGPPHRPHHGPHPEPHHRPHSHPPPQGPTGPPTTEKLEDDMEIIEEKSMFETWMLEVTAEIETADVRTSYGLWYSTICVREKRMGDSEGHKDMDQSSSEDEDGKKRHCKCKKISTKCALKYAFMYENLAFLTRNGGFLSYKNFGYASLKEHQVENCVVLAFLVLGLISAIGGFRKANGCRCAGVACVIFMLLAAFIAIVPVSRLSHYSVNRAHQNTPVKVHTPYSAIATGFGSLFAAIAALVAGCALMKMKGRKETAGKWYQFNNELDLTNEKKEKPGVYFTAEALPVKPGLYDACDFGDVKPVEELKNPEAEEEKNEFIL